MINKNGKIKNCSILFYPKLVLKIAFKKFKIKLKNKKIIERVI
jgi:hypothetical protein